MCDECVLKRREICFETYGDITEKYAISVTNRNWVYILCVVSILYIGNILFNSFHLWILPISS